MISKYVVDLSYSPLQDKNISVDIFTSFKVSLVLPIKKAVQTLEEEHGEEAHSSYDFFLLFSIKIKYELIIYHHYIYINSGRI